MFQALWSYQRTISGIAMVVGAPYLLSAAGAENFYSEKKIDLIVGAAAGGGYDTYARAIAKYMPRHTPGNPQIVIRYMPGAGSAIAARYAYNVAPNDGLTIVALTPGSVMGKLIDDKVTALYDPPRFVYLGTADDSVRLCITYKTSPVKTYEDALTHQAILGASGTGGGSRDYAALHTHVNKRKFKIVTGYKGTADTFLAMEQGEIDGVCGISMSSIAATRPNWIQDKSINILVQDSAEPDIELTRNGVPHVLNFIKDADDRKAAQLVVSQSTFSRPYAVGPNTPSERVNILRGSFMQALADKDLLVEAEKLKIDIKPLSGEKVQQLVQELHTDSSDVIRRSRQIVEP